MYRIDKTDAAIIKILHKKSRTSNTDIAKRINVSEGTVRNRIDRLVKEEIIKLVVVTDPFKLGFTVVGNLKISVIIEMAEHVGTELSKLPEIWYVGQITGKADFDVDFIAKSMEDFNNLMIEKIHKIKGITKTETSFVLRHFKNKYDWGTPLD